MVYSALLQLSKDSDVHDIFVVISKNPPITSAVLRPIFSPLTQRAIVRSQTGVCGGPDTNNVQLFFVFLTEKNRGHHLRPPRAPNLSMSGSEGAREVWLFLEVRVFRRFVLE